MGSLKNKKALVTSGAQGIGEAVVRRLIEAGCHAAVHYLTSGKKAKELVALAKKSGLKAEAIKADLTREDEAQAMVEKAAAALGGLDILVNNTGGLVARRRLGEIETDFWNHVMDLNMTSMVRVTRAALPFLKKSSGASIVNLGSLAGRKGGHPGSLAYATSKGAVMTFTRALADELAADNIRVNAAAPGFILGSRFHATHTTKESADKTVANLPVGRAGNPDDVARAVVFLASEYDGFIHGAALDINGGAYYA